MHNYLNSFRIVTIEQLEEKEKGVLLFYDTYRYVCERLEKRNDKYTFDPKRKH